jgi:protein-disulfide isomerase
LDLIATLGVVVLTAAMLLHLWRLDGANQPRGQATKRPSPAAPASPVSVDGAAIDGDRAARVAIIEYSDFQCPYCGAFARDTLPGLQEKYIKTGRAFLAFRHLPLSFHKFAGSAAIGAECAGRQGKFWPMHDRLFLQQAQLEPQRLIKDAQELGLDVSSFDECLGSNVRDRVSADAASAKVLGISGTPTFLVGSVLSAGQVRVSTVLTGAQTLDQFDAALSNLIEVANSHP